MKTKFSESLMLILVMVVIGGGIYCLQSSEAVIGSGTDSVLTLQGPIRNCVKELEEVAAIVHDYLNGYLSGSDWGTALPPHIMKEEIERLKLKYRLADELAIGLYPEGSRLDPVLGEFYLGFMLAEEGLKNKDTKTLLKAHDIFHRLDYEVFRHKRRSEHDSLSTAE